MPAFDFDTPTSMGYNPSLPYAMDNAYGQTKAFKSFIKAAHAQGIAVILDVVYNHFGPQSLDNGLGKIDGWWVDDKEGIYFYPDIRAYTAWGAARPDFGRAEVRWFIRNHEMTCLSELHLDGLRLDSTINIHEAIGNPGDNGPIPDGWTLLRWLGEEKRASQPWKILIAEDLQNDATITQDALFGGMGLDSQWDSWFLGRVRDLMFAASDDARSASSVAEAIGKSYNSAGAFARVIYTESHDEADKRRIVDQIAPGNSNGWFARKLSTLGSAIVFTSPGIPMIFMGQEFLEYQIWTDAQTASPMDWGLQTTNGGMWNLYQRLIQLRRNWDNNTRGLAGSNINIFHVNESAGIIAFHRWDQGGPGDDVIVVVNLKNAIQSSYNIGFPRPGNWYLRFNSDWSGYWSDYGNAGYDTTAQPGGNQNMPNNGNVGIGPYSVIIYSQ
jgi:1,4-alpha-glucan branching enzyme